MLTASANSLGVGASMPPMSQIVTSDASAKFHSLCVAGRFTNCDTAGMADTDKNGGPNYLRAWREFYRWPDGRRGMTQQELAERVGTNANMIGYLESGERGLSAKWLRKLAPALNTTSGMLLEHDPEDLDSDAIDIWVHASERQRKQITEIAKTLVKSGANG